ncbi:hypothetical protein, partial [Streptomyces sp. IBSBF 2394]|uniref:hypothetical protein n=1 Tax=Streptomyces sp. IBSBF 2394 TaxID=2903532 RepID=UPI002FDB9D1F
ILRSALIGDASITTAKIADGAITNAKIGNAQITAAKIGDAQVDTLQIAGRAITLPYSVVQNREYVWNVSPNVWREVVRLSVIPSGHSANITCSFEAYVVSGGDVWAKARLRRLE